MKLGILGGTFDPVHQGHLAIALAARQQLHLDRVILIPAGIPPHKTAQDLTAAEHRFRMIELAVRGMPGLEVSSVEIDRAGVSYTVDTLRELKKIYPGAELVMILGSDSLKTFSQWHESEAIMGLARLAAASRPGFSFPEQENNIYWLDLPEYPFASSEIRKQIASGRPTAGALPPAVEDYIRENGLYRAS